MAEKMKIFFSDKSWFFEIKMEEENEGNVYYDAELPTFPPGISTEQQKQTTQTKLHYSTAESAEEIRKLLSSSEGSVGIDYRNWNEEYQQLTETSYTDTEKEYERVKKLRQVKFENFSIPI
jgi:hypothetical protein